jgi:TRAP-type mannitol/chloroaromatic compound transport system permease large subunit
MTIALILVVLLIMGTPVGVALGLAGLAGMFSIGGLHFASLAPAKVFNGLNIFPFLAMPFFILAGEIMNHTGITSRLVQFSQALVGHFRGGLAHSNMVASVFFSGITGAATADAAAFGRTLVPAMVEQGYSRSYACAVTAAGSIIGPTSMACVCAPISRPTNCPGWRTSSWRPALWALPARRSARPRSSRRRGLMTS